MKRVPAVLAFLATLSCAAAQEAPGANGAPSENRYDIVGKVFAPICSVLLMGGQSPNRAMSFHMVMKDVTGRLPKQFNGATLDAAAQFPNKVKLVAPVLGEQVTVCRDGDVVWATPGAKVEYLLEQFKGKLPKPIAIKANTPIFLPVTAQQAVFLPALFTLDEGKQFDTLDGEPVRVISGGLMPELAKSTKSEDFRAEMWVAAGYVPRQMRITRRDFTATVQIKDLQFVPKLPGKTWQPPEGVTDIYRTTPEVLQQLLFVVMNSVNVKPKADAGEAIVPDAMPTPAAPQLP